MNDERRGIALCRAGTDLLLLGFGAEFEVPLETTGGEPEYETYLSFSQYLGSTDTWKMRSGRVEGHDQLILARTEKAELAVFWDGDSIRHQLLGVFVEP